MKKFNISYRDDTYLADGRTVSKMVPFGSMTEDDSGTKTIELRDYQHTTFHVVEETKEAV